MAPIDFQKHFFLCLEKKAGTKNLAPFLQKYLNLGKTAAYNRLKGVTELSINEMYQLIEAFDLPIDQLMKKNGNKVEFTIPSMHQKPKTIQEFFFGIHSYMKEMAKYESSYIYYTTNEVPLFQYLFSPPVAAFKLFIWARSVWNWDSVQDQKFNCQKYIEAFDIPNETDKVLDLYLQLDSTEFWNENILNNTINQIKYYETAGIFQSRNDINKVYDGLNMVLRHAEQMARKGQKFHPNSVINNSEQYKSFNLYCNHFIFTNNTILTISPIQKSVFTTFDSPNFMKSDNEGFINYTIDSFKTIKERSSNISQESEKERKTYFGKLYKQILAAKTAI